MRTIAVIIFLLMSSMVLSNHRLDRLENVFKKRIADVQNNPLIASHYQTFMDRYAQANQARLRMESQGSIRRGETHYMSDLLTILIDIYQLEDKVASPDIAY